MGERKTPVETSEPALWRHLYREEDQMRDDFADGGEVGTLKAPLGEVGPHIPMARRHRRCSFEGLDGGEVLEKGGFRGQLNALKLS